MSAHASPHPHTGHRVSVVPGPPRQPTDIDRLIGLRLMALRKAKGVSQAALGEAVGVSFQQVRKYETGKNRIGAGKLAVLAQLLDVGVASFYGEEGAEGEGRAEMFEHLSRPGALDLLRAYAAITDDAMRRHALALMRSAASLDRDAAASVEG